MHKMTPYHISVDMTGEWIRKGGKEGKGRVNEPHWGLVIAGLCREQSDEEFHTAVLGVTSCQSVV